MGSKVKHINLHKSKRVENAQMMGLKGVRFIEELMDDNNPFNFAARKISCNSLNHYKN